MAPIPSAPGYYAGTDGTIYSEWRQNVGPYGDLHALCGTRNQDGYIVIWVTRGGDRMRQRPAARLVCEAFYGPAPPAVHASHLNHNPSDNRPSNLRWETPKQNMARSSRDGRLSKPTQPTP